MQQQASCRIMEYVQQLAERLRIDSQLNSEEFDGYWPQAVAHLRHEYSNYDVLLEELGMYCLRFTDDWRDREKAERICLPRIQDGADCPLRVKAYQMLKAAANALFEAKRK